jgi:hypothetical protein
MASLNGIVLGIGFVPILLQMFSKQDPGQSIVRVNAGLNLPNETNVNSGGATPSIALFDGNGNRIGIHLGSDTPIGAGQYADLKVPPINKGNDVPPEYISIVAGGSDSICVDYIALTPPSGEYWVFYGDNAVSCGAPWYHSHTEIKTGGDPFYPSYFWITRPDKSGKKANPAFPQGVGIHITDFTSDPGKIRQYQDNPDTVCKSDPRFKLYDKLEVIDCIPTFDPILQYNSDGSDQDLNALNTPGKVHCDLGPGQTGTAAQWLQLTKFIPDFISVKRKRYPSDIGFLRSRGMTERKREEPQCDFDGHLVISDIDAHSAKDLCMSNTSSGPDFVSTNE